MTLRNKLIQAAKAGAPEFLIRPKDVNAVVEHARHSLGMIGLQPEKIRDAILSGKVTIINTKIRVAGRPADSERAGP